MSKEIRFKPEGWVNEIVFENGIMKCGSEEAGIGIYVPGHDHKEHRISFGVIKNSDALRLRDAIDEHLKEVGYPSVA